MKTLYLEVSAINDIGGKLTLELEKISDRYISFVRDRSLSKRNEMFEYIVYALFGKCTGRNGEEICKRSLQADRKTKSYIYLKFSHEGKIYEIERRPAYDRNKEYACIETQGEKAVTGWEKVDAYVENLLGTTEGIFKRTASLKLKTFDDFLEMNDSMSAKSLDELFGNGTVQSTEDIREKLGNFIENQLKSEREDIKRYSAIIKENTFEDEGEDSDKSLENEYYLTLGELDRLRKKRDEAERDHKETYHVKRAIDMVLVENEAYKRANAEAEEFSRQLSEEEKKLENIKLKESEIILGHHQSEVMKHDIENFRIDIAALKKEVQLHEDVEDRRHMYDILEKEYEQNRLEYESIDENIGKMESEQEECQSLINLLPEVSRELFDAEREYNELKNACEIINEQRESFIKYREKAAHFEVLNAKLSELQKERKEKEEAVNVLKEKYLSDDGNGLADIEYNKAKAELVFAEDNILRITNEISKEKETVALLRDNINAKLVEIKKAGGENPVRPEEDDFKNQLDRIKDDFAAIKEKLAGLENKSRECSNAKVRYEALLEDIMKAKRQREMMSVTLEHKKIKISMAKDEESDVLDRVTTKDREEAQNKILELEREIGERQLTIEKIDADYHVWQDSMSESNAKLEKMYKEKTGVFERLKEARSDYEKAMISAGFSSENECEIYLKEAETLQDIENTAEKSRSDYDALEKRKTELEKQLGEKLSDEKAKRQEIEACRNKCRIFSGRKKMTDRELQSTELLKKTLGECDIHDALEKVIIYQANIQLEKFSDGRLYIEKEEGNVAGKDLIIKDFLEETEQKAKDIRGLEEFSIAYALALATIKVNILMNLESRSLKFIPEIVFVDDGFEKLNRSVIREAIRIMTQYSEQEYKICILSKDDKIAQCVPTYLEYN